MKKKWLFALLCVALVDALICICSVSPFPDVISKLSGGTQTHYNDTISKTIWCVIFDALIVFCFAMSKKLFAIPKAIFKNKSLVWSLAKNDFKTRFSGSYLGTFWAFVNPIVTILLYWFIFQFAFKAQNIGDIPFVLWLTSGLVPWFLFSEALTSGTNSMIEYSYLVKKVVFEIDILPAIKIIASLLLHFVFLGFTLILCVCLGCFPTLYALQIIYYLICMLCLVTGFVYATSAIVLFFRDLAQFINVFMQVFMWMTPIMWNSNIIPSAYLWIFKLNPMFYVITGYRDSLLNKIFVTQHMGYTLYFWVFVIAMFMLGTTIFRRLRPHFADVL